MSKPEMAEVYLVRKGREVSGGPARVEVDPDDNKSMRKLLLDTMKQRAQAGEHQAPDFVLRVHKLSDHKRWFEYPGRS